MPTAKKIAKPFYTEFAKKYGAGYTPKRFNALAEPDIRYSVEEVKS